LAAGDYSANSTLAFEVKKKQHVKVLRAHGRIAIEKDAVDRDGHWLLDYILYGGWSGRLFGVYRDRYSGGNSHSLVQNRPFLALRDETTTNNLKFAASSEPAAGSAARTSLVFSLSGSLESTYTAIPVEILILWSRLDYFWLETTTNNRSARIFSIFQKLLSLIQLSGLIARLSEPLKNDACRSASAHVAHSSFSRFLQCTSMGQSFVEFGSCLTFITEAWNR